MTIEKEVAQLKNMKLIRDVIDQYAYCADSRDAQGQMSLFTQDTVFEVYYDVKADQATQTIIGREGLRPIFDNLNSYDATMHFNGQCTIKLNHDSATAVTYCMAHHLTKPDGKQSLMVAAIRYHDVLVKLDNQWLFSERKLYVDWIENR